MKLVHHSTSRNYKSGRQCPHTPTLGLCHEETLLQTHTFQYVTFKTLPAPMCSEWRVLKAMLNNTPQQSTDCWYFLPEADKLYAMLKYFKIFQPFSQTKFWYKDTQRCSGKARLFLAGEKEGRTAYLRRCLSTPVSVSSMNQSITDTQQTISVEYSQGISVAI